MSHFVVDERDIRFILNEQLKYGDLCGLDRYRDLDVETLDMLLTEAVKFAGGVVAPLQESGDREGVVYSQGKVRCASGFKEAFGLCGGNGWIAATEDTGYGGQGFPRLMGTVTNDLMYGACISFQMAPSLTHGAGGLIESFGTKELKERFVPNMFAGRWSGTMCLTEPQAGSNLGSIRTKAVPEGDHFKIKGTKIFITWGEHDLCENIIHLVLARIEGSPPGVKGISLFVVPKIRVREDGSLGDPNDVFCLGVEHKLGLHGSPTCVLNFGDNDDCMGYLCGTADKGLAHMFQMMNSARIHVGVAGIGIAATAFRNALAYAKERIQGSDVARRKAGEVPIIDHPDVRRMLLWMKAAVDGMRSMAYTVGYWLDLSFECPDDQEKRRYLALVEFMTPIVKAYCSEMSFRVCETAIQCLGGYGFTREYPLEQYLRDSKILSLYEGTNGIQSMDLMGRKLTMEGGEPFRAFIAELESFCDRNSDHHKLGIYVTSLAAVVRALNDLAGKIRRALDQDPALWASTTHPALICYGEAVMVWRLLDLALIAQNKIDKGDSSDFYKGKVMQATYFSDITMPLLMARIDIAGNASRDVVEIPEGAF